MLSPAELEVLCGPERPFSPGEVGCYLSHMKVYRLIVERGVPVAAVLEDDAHLNPMVTELLVPGIRSDWFDLCFLDCWQIGFRGKVFCDLDDAIRLSPHFTAYRLAPPHGTHAYLITQDAARLRLSHAEPMRESIDWYESIRTTARFYGLSQPNGAWLDEAFSTFSYTSTKAFRNREPWHKKWRRFPPWFDFRNLAHPDMIKARRSIPRLQREGILPAAGNWVPLPPSVVGGGPVRPRGRPLESGFHRSGNRSGHCGASIFTHTADSSRLRSAPTRRPDAAAWASPSAATASLQSRG